MEKQKKIKLSNQLKWMILVGIVLLTFVILVTTRIISYTKTVATKAETKSTVENDTEEVVDQVNLVNTSKMSPEELKKLNAEEQKKVEQKKQEEAKKNQNKKTPTQNYSQYKYYIKVNYTAQVVTVYTRDKDGKFTVPVRACICSTGAATPTSGVYRTGVKYGWGKLYGNVWGQYCTQVVGDILFHSVPYKQNRKDTLVSAYYDRLGRKDSMGCIRLTTIDALWLYNNCPSGTQVEFYSSSNPGPLGKPTAKKVSNAPGNLKNWDPTDPDANNPWRNYNPNKDDNKKPNDNTNTTTNTTEPTDNTQTNTGTENENNVTTPDTPVPPANTVDPEPPTNSENTQVPPDNTTTTDPEPTQPENTQTQPEIPTNQTNPATI